MLRPIPRQILSQSATVYVPSGVDEYQNPTADTETVVNNVHLQTSTTMTTGGTTATAGNPAILFVDANISTPRIDWAGIVRSSQELGKTVPVVVDGITYQMHAVDVIPDNIGRVHHWECLLR